jgi:putative phosphoesterase
LLSDSHGRVDNVERALCVFGVPTAILFLGDGLRDIERADTRGARVFAVRGNCDAVSTLDGERVPEETMLRFGEYNIMLMHGHRYSPLAAKEHAARSGADVLVMGHTHKKYERRYGAGSIIGEYETQKPLLVINPGSIGASRDGACSFGRISIVKDGILLSHGEI